MGGRAGGRVGGWLGGWDAAARDKACRPETFKRRLLKLSMLVLGFPTSRYCRASMVIHITVPYS